MIFTLYQILVGDQIKKNEMGDASCTYGRQERYMQDFGGDTWEKEPT